MSKIPLPPLVPPAPPLPMNGVFKKPYIDQSKSAHFTTDTSNSDRDSGTGGSLLVLAGVPGLDLSDDEFSEEFSSSSNSSRRQSASETSGIPTPPPPPALPTSYLSTDGVQVSPSRIGIQRFLSYLSDSDLSDFSDRYMYDDSRDEHYISAPQEEAVCIVCYDTVYGQPKRQCCSQTVCTSCISAIVQTNVNEGQIFIACPNPDCDKGVISRDEISRHADKKLKEKYERLRLQVEGDGTKKPCPNCCHITEHTLPSKFRKFTVEDVRLTCEKCNHVWCFNCHAPWHEGATCKQYRKGDRHFKKWTKEHSHSGIANCQKCPFCRVYIQRSTGCDHMTCNRCDTHFCYKCGERFLEFPGIGSHYNKTSILGCKYNYNQRNPTKRVAVRGGYFGAKMAMLTGYPVLFVAGAAVAVVVGAVALPIWGGYRLYKYNKNTRRLRRRRRI